MKELGSYYLSYNLIRIKRFVTISLISFIFQYLSIISIPGKFVISPLYPAIGIAFSMYFILGRNTIPGLLLGTLLAYFLKGYNFISIFLYAISDVGCGVLGAYLCQNVFSSDVPRLIKFREFKKFVLINALFTCVISGGFKLFALKTNVYLNIGKTIKVFLLFWLGDLNSIIIIFMFLFTWMSIYQSRESISEKIIYKPAIIFFAVILLLCIVFIKKPIVLSLLLLLLLISSHNYKNHGIILGSSLFYITGIIYSAFFLRNFEFFYSYLNAGYILVPFVLLFTFVVSYYLHVICHPEDNVSWPKDLYPSQQS